MVTVGESRYEMLMVEVQEERKHLLRVILLAFGVGRTRFPRNPVRASFLLHEEPIQNYPWNSYRSYLKELSTRPTW